MDSLVNWFTSNGGSLDRSAMGITEFSEQGFGAVALKDISESHVLFTIPRSLTLSMRTSELPNIIGVQSWKRYKLHKGWAGLMLCMMWEEVGAKGGSGKSGSKWGGYLDSLPKTFDTPMFWTEQELNELKGSTLVDKIGKEEAERDYREKVLPALLSRPDIFDPAALASAYSLEKFHIMGSRILSRSFNVQPWEQQDEDELDADHEPSSDPAEGERGGGGNDQSMDVDVPENEEGGEDGGDGEGENAEEDDDDDDDDPADVAMVPMADMLNARYGSENAKLFHEPTELKMITTKAIRRGDQIYNTYGDLPNAELLRKYGHVDLLPLPPLPSSSALENPVCTMIELGNPADVVEIPAVLVTESVKTWYEEREMEAPNLEERIDWWLEEGGDDVFALDISELLPDPLVSFSRLLLSPPQEWVKAREKGKPPKPKIDEVTRVVVKDVLERRRETYPTSMEEDVTLLESEIPLNRRNAVIVRLGEKRILREALMVLRQDEERDKADVKGDKEKRKRQLDGEKGEKEGNKKARR